MARTTSFQTLITLSTIFSLFLAITSASDSDQYYKTPNPKELGLHKTEKLTRIHFYFHAIFSGENKTIIQVAGPESNVNSTGFGLLTIVDHPLTVGPELTSERIGSAQGMNAFASQTKVELLVVQNYVFTAGKFNGSTLAILGHNEILSDVRELPIVGGTGAFRFARGFAQARTYTLNLTSLNAVVEHNVYVFHY